MNREIRTKYYILTFTVKKVIKWNNYTTVTVVITAITLMTFTLSTAEKVDFTLTGSNFQKFDHHYKVWCVYWCKMFDFTECPPSPSIEMSGDLREGESLIVTCSALTPCPGSPPKLTWGHKLQPHNYIQENADGTFTTQIQDNISLSDKHDGYNITCSAKYPLTAGTYLDSPEQKVTLNISCESTTVCLWIMKISIGESDASILCYNCVKSSPDAPKDTMASVSRSLSAGGWVNLTCTSRANPSVSRFTWFRTNPDGDTNVSEGAVYSVNATDGGVYFCQATNALDCQRSPNIHLKGKYSQM